MRETSARLLRLLSLLGTRPDWSGADLAGRLDVTVRTVRRDVDKLRGLGYPVHASRGTAGGYRLGAGAALPPLLLDDEEAIAVAFSLRSTASQAVTGAGEACLRALVKLEQVLPARLRVQVSAVTEATVPLVTPAVTVDPEVLSTIARACRSHERLAMRYRDRGGAETGRSVEPHRLVQAGHRWYLVARDVDRDDWRTFRTDRIASLRPMGRFVPRAAPDAASFVANAVTTAPYRFRAVVGVHAPVEVVAERMPATVGVLTPDGPDRCVLTLGADDLDAIVFHLGMLGRDYTVREPPELIRRVGEWAERMRRAVEGGGAVGTPSGERPPPDRS